MGNIVVEAGPPGPPRPCSWRTWTKSASSSSRLRLTGPCRSLPQGGVVSSAWEGQTALVHFDPPGAPSKNTGWGRLLDPKWKTSSLTATARAPLRGVFRVRVTADFGSTPARRRPGSASTRRNLPRSSCWSRGHAGHQLQAGRSASAYSDLGPIRGRPCRDDGAAGRWSTRLTPARLPGRVYPRVVHRGRRRAGGRDRDGTSLRGADGAHLLDRYVRELGHTARVAPLRVTHGSAPARFSAQSRARTSRRTRSGHACNEAAAAASPCRWVTQGGTDGSSSPSGGRRTRGSRGHPLQSLARRGAGPAGSRYVLLTRLVRGGRVSAREE